MRITLAVVLFLFSQPARAGVEWPWPTGGDTSWAAIEPARHVSKDIDGGGVIDDLFEFHARGTGFRTWLTCVHHGETKARACVEFVASSYAHFRGYRVFTAGPDDGAAKLLAAEIPSCRAADPSDPSQGAMWALHRPSAGAKALRWSPGKLPRQTPACLSVEAARDFVGGLAWHAKGDVSADTPPWTVVYEPNWTRGTFSREPVEKLAADTRFRLYANRHALAIYDKEERRHAWIVNLSGHVPADFKVDRWATITGVEQVGRDLFDVQVARGPLSARGVRLNVPRLLAGRPLRLKLRD